MLSTSNIDLKIYLQLVRYSFFYSKTSIIINLVLKFLVHLDIWMMSFFYQCICWCRIKTCLVPTLMLLTWKYSLNYGIDVSLIFSFIPIFKHVSKCKIARCKRKFVWYCLHLSFTMSNNVWKEKRANNISVCLLL